MQQNCGSVCSFALLVVGSVWMHWYFRLIYSIGYLGISRYWCRGVCSIRPCIFCTISASILLCHQSIIFSLQANGFNNQKSPSDVRSFNGNQIDQVLYLGKLLQDKNHKYAQSRVRGNAQRTAIQNCQFHNCFHNSSSGYLPGDLHASRAWEWANASSCIYIAFFAEYFAIPIILPSELRTKYQRFMCLTRCSRFSQKASRIFSIARNRKSSRMLITTRKRRLHGNQKCFIHLGWRFRSPAYHRFIMCTTQGWNFGNCGRHWIRKIIISCNHGPVEKNARNGFNRWVMPIWLVLNAVSSPKSLGLLMRRSGTISCLDSILTNKNIQKRYEYLGLPGIWCFFRMAMNLSSQN